MRAVTLKIYFSRTSKAPFQFFVPVFAYKWFQPVSVLENVMDVREHRRTRGLREPGKGNDLNTNATLASILSAARVREHRERARNGLTPCPSGQCAICVSFKGAKYV